MKNTNRHKTIQVEQNLKNRFNLKFMKELGTCQTYDFVYLYLKLNSVLSCEHGI